MVLHLKLDVRTESVRVNLAAIIEKIEKGAKEVSREHAYKVRDTARTMMDGGRSGIKYGRLPNRSSAPGEAPASQSGKMRGSIRIWNNGSAYFRVGSPLWYANFLQAERDRPLMVTALEEVRQPYYNAIKAMIDRSVR